MGLHKGFMLICALALAWSLASCQAEEIRNPVSIVTEAPQFENPSKPAQELPETASPPKIYGLVDQSISDWSLFPILYLNEYLEDADTPPEEITWKTTGFQELLVQIHGDQLNVMLPYASWVGSETLTLQACDPDSLCDQVQVEFSVREENDPPQIIISQQVFWPGMDSLDLSLEDLVIDEETPSKDLDWEISKGAELITEIKSGRLYITLPRIEWAGKEAINFKVCDPEGQCTQKDAIFRTLTGNDVVVTKTGNAGFLLTAGGKRVLIDSLFGGSGTEIVERMNNSEPPFDNVDLILVTHNHGDHFDPHMTAKYLENNPGTAFASTADVGEVIRNTCPECPDLDKRLFSFQLSEGDSEEISFNGIYIEAYLLTHGVNAPPNLGYRIEMGGFQFFHTGDLDNRIVDLAYIQPFDLPGHHIDVAFAPWFMFTEIENHDFINLGLQAHWLFPMHFQTLDLEQLHQIKQNFPDSIVLSHPLDSWVK